MRRVTIGGRRYVTFYGVFNGVNGGIEVPLFKTKKEAEEHRKFLVEKFGEGYEHALQIVKVFMIEFPENENEYEGMDEMIKMIV